MERRLGAEPRWYGALRRVAAGIMAGSLIFASTAQACTSLLLKTADGGFVYARTMEFGFHLDSDAIKIPRLRSGTNAFQIILQTVTA